VKEDEVDKPVRGMATFVVEAMRDGVPEAGIEGYRARLRHYRPDHVLAALLRPENIDKWSKEIAGTENDGVRSEVRAFAAEELLDAEHRYYVKRCLRDGWQEAVKQLLAPATSSDRRGTGVSSGAANRTSSPEPGRMVHVAVAGQQSGPYPEVTIRTMIQSGQLKPDSTHVWWRGLQKWVLLKDCPDLLAMLPLS
jgi:hypothetical protein